MYSYLLDPATGRGQKRELDAAALQEARDRRREEEAQRRLREELEREEERRWRESDAYKGYLLHRAADRRRAELELKFRACLESARWKENHLLNTEKEVAEDEAYLLHGERDEHYNAKVPAIKRRLAYYQAAVNAIRAEVAVAAKELQDARAELAALSVPA